MRRALLSTVAWLLVAQIGWAQNKLSVHWEELTAGDFRAAIQQSQGTCLLPFGILEKHGPHLPLGTDLLDVRHAALTAAEREYAVVFPEYYFGQIFEAKHEPGTVAYSSAITACPAAGDHRRDGAQRLQEGHHRQRPRRQRASCCLFLRKRSWRSSMTTWCTSWAWWVRRRVRRLRNPQVDMHAGETETSTMLISRPDLVHMDRAKSESGADQARLKLPDTLYTAIWWYARFPNHYSGDGSEATRELGESRMNAWIDAIVTGIRSVKADQASLQLQNEFFEKTNHPLDTKPVPDKVK